MSTKNGSVTDSLPKQPGQVSSLPPLTSYLTGHDESSGKSIIQSTRPAEWTPYEENTTAFNVVYTTSEFPPSLNSNVDIEKHDNLVNSKKLGVVNPGGTVCRIVDFGPGYECMMHRTQSLDYGVVLEGCVEMLLDSDQKQLMYRGDVAVQRATMHAWRNPSKTDWARMLFVAQDCQELSVGGKVLKEHLGTASDYLPPSGNDV